MSRPWDGRERFSDTTGDEYEPGDLETTDRRVTPWWQQAPVTGDPETPPLIEEAEQSWNAFEDELWDEQ